MLGLHRGGPISRPSASGSCANWTHRLERWWPFKSDSTVGMMTAGSKSRLKISAEIMALWDIQLVEFMGGRENQHWLVETGGSRFVLRRCCEKQSEPNNTAYELEVLRRLSELRWPVPELVREPILSDQRLWCLFTFLPGTRRTSEGPDELRKRGRLLAELHESTASMADMGQRMGWYLSQEVLLDPELAAAINDYGLLFPNEAHVLQWHIEKVRENLATLDTSVAEPIVLHSDFTNWNLLFEDERLSGILDLESTHLNHRVADFALSWRGNQDEVIEGYQEVRQLDELDWQLLIPAYWAWLLIGVKDAIKKDVAGGRSSLRLDWQLKHFSRRSKYFGEYSEPYPGFITKQRSS